MAFLYGHSIDYSKIKSDADILRLKPSDRNWFAAGLRSFELERLAAMAKDPLLASELERFAYQQWRNEERAEEEGYN